MKLHSSIFSSDTLSARWRIPAGAALAIFLVSIANVWAYFAEKNGILYTSVPSQLIENALDELSNNNGIWLLGNSTLAAGFDENVLNETQKRNSAIIKLGSATLDTTVHLSEIALQADSAKPDKIIIFFTKDDLNQNGSRANASKSYHQAMNGAGVYEHFASLIPVYSTRFAITDKLRNAIASIVAGRKAEAESSISTRKQSRYRDLSKKVDSTYLLNLGKDYTPIDIDFSRLGQLAKTHETKVYLVAPPVCSAVADWQKRYAPQYSWQSIVSKVTVDASNYGIRVLNYTDLLESTTEYFKDVYHLNSRGSRAFTNHLLNDISNGA